MHFEDVGVNQKLNGSEDLLPPFLNFQLTLTVLIFDEPTSSSLFLADGGVEAFLGDFAGTLLRLKVVGTLSKKLPLVLRNLQNFEESLVMKYN